MDNFSDIKLSNSKQKNSLSKKKKPNQTNFEEFYIFFLDVKFDYILPPSNSQIQYITYK